MLCKSHLLLHNYTTALTRIGLLALVLWWDNMNVTCWKSKSSRGKPGVDQNNSFLARCRLNNNSFDWCRCSARYNPWLVFCWYNLWLVFCSDMTFDWCSAWYNLWLVFCPDTSFDWCFAMIQPLTGVLPIQPLAVVLLIRPLTGVFL